MARLQWWIIMWTPSQWPCNACERKFWNDDAAASTAPAVAEISTADKYSSAGTHLRRRGNSHTVLQLAHTWGLRPSASAMALALPQSFQLYISQLILNPRDRNGDPGGIACMQAQTMHCTRLMLVASKGRCVLNHDDDSRLNQPAILMWQTDGRKALAWRNRNLSSLKWKKKEVDKITFVSSNSF